MPLYTLTLATLAIAMAGAGCDSSPPHPTHRTRTP